MPANKDGYDRPIPRRRRASILRMELELKKEGGAVCFIGPDSQWKENDSDSDWTIEDDVDGPCHDEGSKLCRNCGRKSRKIQEYQAYASDAVEKLADEFETARKFCLEELELQRSKDSQKNLLICFNSNSSTNILANKDGYDPPIPKRRSASIFRMELELKKEGGSYCIGLNSRCLWNEDDSDWMSEDDVDGPCHDEESKSSRKRRKLQEYLAYVSNVVGKLADDVETVRNFCLEELEIQQSKDSQNIQDSEVNGQDASKLTSEGNPDFSSSSKETSSLQQVTYDTGHEEGISANDNHVVDEEISVDSSALLFKETKCILL